MSFWIKWSCTTAPEDQTQGPFSTWEEAETALPSVADTLTAEEGFCLRIVDDEDVIYRKMDRYDN